MSDTTPVPGASSSGPSKSGQILSPVNVPEKFTLHLRRRSQEAIKPEGGREAIAISSPGDLHTYYDMRMSYQGKDGQRANANDAMLTTVEGIPFNLGLLTGSGNRRDLELTLTALAHTMSEVELHIKRGRFGLNCKYDKSRYVAPYAQFTRRRM